jgi:hypothetical protein
MMKRLLLVLCLAVSMVGCGGALTNIQTACVKAMPVFAQMQTYIADANIAIDQVEALEILMPEAIRNDLVVGIDIARLSLRTVAAALQTMADSCTEPDPATLFADFAKNWETIEQVIAKSKSGPGLKLGKTTQPPMIVLKLKK